MITESFDNQSPAIINPPVNENAPQVDACILTFSHVIEKFVLENYDCEPDKVFPFIVLSRMLERSTGLLTAIHRSR